MDKIYRLLTLLGFGSLAVLLLLPGVPVRADVSLAVTLVQVNDLARADPMGDRVLTAVVGGKLLMLDRTYTLAVIGFIAKGGDGYQVLIKAPRLVDLQAAKLLVGQVADYITAAGKFDTTLAPRVRPTPVN
jgi:hypothetical protein